MPRNIHVRFGFLRFCRCEKWSHTSRLDTRHQRYKVCLRFGFLRLSTIKKCPHMLRSDHSSCSQMSRACQLGPQRGVEFIQFQFQVQCSVVLAAQTEPHRNLKILVIQRDLIFSEVCYQTLLHHYHVNLQSDQLRVCQLNQHLHHHFITLWTSWILQPCVDTQSGASQGGVRQLYPGTWTATSLPASLPATIYNSYYKNRLNRLQLVTLISIVYTY